MIEKTITLKAVRPNGWAYEITYEDGGQEYNKKVKKSTPGANLLSPGKSVRIQLDKNDKGYWDFTNIEDTGSSQPVSTPAPVEKPAVQNVSDNKVRCVAFSYVKDLIAAGKLEFEDIYNATIDFERFMTGQFNPVHKDNWMIKYLEKEAKQPVKTAKKLDPDAVPF